MLSLEYCDLIFESYQLLLVQLASCFATKQIIVRRPLAILVLSVDP